ncbi:hypothetical protein PoB_007466900, partial [Plakobranchus ocellatus]
MSTCSLYEQGLVCVGFEDLSESNNPCPIGQKLHRVDDKLECAYFDDAIVDVPPDVRGRCVGKGEMLVQSRTGFFCRRTEEANVKLPDCPKGEIFAKTDMGF